MPLNDDVTPDTAPLKKIYLAGPDVFRLDSGEAFAGFKKNCTDMGFIPLSPLDSELGPGMKPGPEMAMVIYKANHELIKECDAVAVNMNAFHGAEPDSGSVWEMGCAVALGKPVFVYMDDVRPYLERVSEKIGADKAANGEMVDRDNGMYIEAMGLPLNLMLACSATRIVKGDLPEALVAIQEFNMTREMEAEAKALTSAAPKARKPRVF